MNILKDDKKFKIIGFVDNIGKNIFDFKYLGSDKFLGQLRNKYKHAVISVGQIKNSKPRKLLYNKLKLNFNLPNIISKILWCQITLLWVIQILYLIMS